MTDRSASQRRISLIMAWLVLLGGPVYFLVVLTLPNPYDYSQSVGVGVILWCLTCAYLVFRGVRRMFKGKQPTPSSLAKVAPISSTGAKDAPVAWLIRKAAFAPSRGSAISHLPEYAARLLTPMGQISH